MFYLGTMRKESRNRRTSNQENDELILEMVQGDSTYKRNPIPGKMKTIIIIIIIIIIILIMMMMMIIITTMII